MKKIIILLLIFYAFLKLDANAQTYTQSADSLLIHLNKSLIPTGVLYDRAWPIAALQNLNVFEPDTTNHAYFLEAYGEMLNSAYNQSGWFPTDTIVHRAYLVKTSIPVGLAFYTYNVIDTNAIQNNLIQMHSDSLYYDTPGRIVSPYNTINTFVASPLIDSVNAHNWLQFSFPSSLFINKSSLTISSLKVDFNDGNGLTTVALNSTYAVHYYQP